MPGADAQLLQAAIARYVADKGGFDFYAERVDRGRSEITADGRAILRRKASGEVLASYNLDDLGLSAEAINAALQNSRPKQPEDDTTTLAAPTDQRQMIGLAASGVLLAGCFAPLVRLPALGTIHYLHNGRGDGVFIVAIALISGYFAFTSAYQRLRISGLIALTLMFSTLWGFQFRISALKASAEESLLGNPYRGIGDALLAAVGLEWGWLLLIGGGIALLVCSELRNTDGVLSLPESALKPDPTYDLKRNIPVQVAATAVAGLVVAAILKNVNS